MKFKEKHNNQNEEQTPWRGLLRLILLVLLVVLAIMAGAAGLLSAPAGSGAARPTPTMMVMAPPATVVVVTATPPLATANDLAEVVEQMEHTNVSLNELATAVATLAHGGQLTEERLSIYDETLNQQNGRISSVEYELSRLVWWLAGAAVLFLVAVLLTLAIGYMQKQIAVSVAPAVELAPLVAPAPAVTYQPPTTSGRLSVARFAGVINQVWIEKPLLYPQHGGPSRSELFRRSYRLIYPGRDVPPFGGSWHTQFGQAFDLVNNLSSTTSSHRVVEVVEEV